MSKANKKAGEYLADATKDGQGANIYISYCRKDKSFVKALYDGLTPDGREIFVEWEDIAAAASEAEQFEEIKESALPLFILYLLVHLFTASSLLICVQTLSAAIAS